jgi:CubicO group peptidase (beta-lactamase class C family)
MTRSLSLSIFLLALVCRVAFAQGDQPRDTYLVAQMTKYHIPGMSLAVVRDGTLVAVKGYGLTNVELSVPASPASVYMIGSVTKQFTAAAIMMLVEDGKLAERCNPGLRRSAGRTGHQRPRGRASPVR